MSRLLLFLLCAAASAQAPVTWTGGADDGRWESAANWDAGRVPTSADAVVIDQASAQVTLSTTTAVAALTVTARDGTVTLDADIVVGGSLVLSRSSAVLSVGGTVDVGGALSWNAGTLSGDGTVTASGGLAVGGAGASSGNVKRLRQVRLVVPTGQTGALSGWYLDAGDGATLEVEAGATVTVTATVGAFDIISGSTARPTFVVDGTLRFEAQSTAAIDWDLDVSGTVEQATAAQTSLAGALTDRGGTYRAAAGTLALSPTTAAVVLGPGSRLEGATGAALRLGGPSMRVDGTVAVDSLVVEWASPQGFGTVSDIVVTRDGEFQVEHLAQVRRSRLRVLGAAPVELASLDLSGDRFEVEGPLTVAGGVRLVTSATLLSAPAGATIGGRLSWTGGQLSGSTVLANGGLETGGGAGSSSNEKRLNGARLVIPAGQTATMGGALFRGSNGAELVISEGATMTVTAATRQFWNASGESSRLTVDGTAVFDAPLQNPLSLQWALGGTGVVEIEALRLEGFRAPDCFSFPDGTIRLTGVLRMPTSQHCLRLNGGPLDVVGDRVGDALVLGTMEIAGDLVLDGDVRVGFADGVTPRVGDFATLATVGGDFSLPDEFSVADADDLITGLVLDPSADETSTVVSLSVTDPAPDPEDVAVSAIVEVPSVWRADRQIPFSVSYRSGTPDGAVASTRVEITHRDVETNAETLYARPSRRDLSDCLNLPPSETPNYDALRCRTGIEDPNLLPPPPDGEDYPALALPPTPSGDFDQAVLLFGSDEGTGSGSSRGALQRSPPDPNRPIECAALPPGADPDRPEGEVQLLTAYTTPGRFRDSANSCLANIVSLSAGLLPGSDCVKAALGTSVGVLDPKADAYGFAVSTGINALGCAISLVPASKVIKVIGVINTLASGAGPLQACFGVESLGGTEVGTTSAAETACVASNDPNEKLGPGTDAADRDAAAHWLRADDTEDAHLFTVFFENLATASAAARDVVVTDTLDLALFDPASFAFAYGGVAEQLTLVEDGLSGSEPGHTASFDLDLRPRLPLVARVDAAFDPATGVIRWDVSTVDPETGDEPDDVLAGFLVPNDDAGNGEGHVGYRVRLRPALPTSSTSGDAARIVFDANAAIDTNPWRVAVDADAPQSAVEPFPAPESDTPTFAVAWAGSDVGSGVASYDIYVSVDGGPAQLWQQATAETSATYEGVLGGRYAFWSVARDRVGQEEEPPTEPDAVVTVRANVATRDAPAVFAVGDVSPNPSAGAATVAVDLPTASRVTVDVIDALGRRVARWTGELAADRHRVPVPGRSLAAGTYVVRVTAHDAGSAGSVRATIVR